jgi:photosystem II stability/assembly factor-like uncharacterized protein
LIDSFTGPAAPGAPVRAVHRVRVALVAVTWILAMALTACGGGGGGSSSPPPDITITAQPSDQHAVDGDTVSLSVTASGSAGYDWQMRNTEGNWIDVPTGTASTLNLGVVHTADSGEQFRVVVTSTANRANQVTSSVVSLTVHDRVIAPTLLSSPAGQSVYDSQDVSLNVTATGTTLAYQWQHSGDNGASWADIAGATGTTYTFTAAISEALGQYRVVVSNSLGSQTSVPAVVSVQVPPSVPLFVLNPTSATAAIGSAVTFNAQAVATPAPSLQWQQSYGASGPWIDIAGATSGSYTLPAVAAADQGRSFRVVATNANGGNTGPAATLVVGGAPTPAGISEQPQDTAIAPGGVATFYAFGYGSQSMGYQWQVSTDTGASFTNVNGATQPALSVGPDALTDDGKLYRVVVSDDLGSATSQSARLSVMAAPTVNGLGFVPYWRPGVTDAAFAASATGNQLRYQWSVGTSSPNVGLIAGMRAVPGATSSTFTLAASSDPAVNFVCVTISNPVGSAQACNFVTALTWRVANPSPTAKALTTIARIDGQTAVASDTNGAILRTADAGVTWTTVSEGFVDDFGVSRIAFNGQNGIATNGSKGLQLSSDGGSHWTSTPQQSYYFGAAAFTPAALAVIVGEQGHIRLSSDQGRTWTDAVTDADTNTLNDVAFGGGIGIAVGDGGAIRRSGDGGHTWTTVHVGGASMGSVAIAPGGTVLVTDNMGMFYRSTDGGLTWIGVSGGFGSPLDRVHFSPSGVALASLSFGKIARSTDDGQTWTQVSSGSGYIEGFASFDGGVVTAIGGGATLLRSTDDGLTWHSSTTGNTSTLLGIAAIDASTAVAVGQGGTIRRTADAGTTWTDIASPSPASLYTVSFGTGAASNIGLAAGDNGTILRTTDAGAHWVVAAQIGGPTNYLHTIAWASVGIVIAAGDGEMLRSTDAGATWSVVPSIGSAELVTGVAFGSATTGVALTSDGQVWHTSDAGATWTPVTSSNPQLMAVAFSSPTNVVALGLSGVALHSGDGGLTWTPATVSFSFLPYFDAVTFRDANTGFAVGRDVYETTDGGVTWLKQDGAAPESMNGVVTLGAHRVLAVGESGLIYLSDAY